jgi:hypothetical protein
MYNTVLIAANFSSYYQGLFKYTFKSLYSVTDAQEISSQFAIFLGSDSQLPN